MKIVLTYDAIHANIDQLPSGAQYAGYTTGSSDIRWTTDDWNNHPGAIRIDQDPSARDSTADVLDVESGAATNAIAADWYRNANASFYRNIRTGQRRPAIYTSASNVTPLVNALIASGVTFGPRLWVADWNLNQGQATSMVVNGGGPFPIVGVQFRNTANYDLSVFSSDWLADMSHVPTPPPPPVPHPIGRGMILSHLIGFNDVYLLGGPKAPVVHIENPTDLAEFGNSLPSQPMHRATIEKYFGALPNTPTPAK